MDNFEKLRGLDLFSGVGGIGLGLSEWVRTIAYCEQDRYAQGVLLSRMRDGSIDRAPIFDDVRGLRGDMFIDKPDIIFGGFPCQDLSLAGVGRGLGGERSGLFFEIVRLTKEIRPSFIFLENVPAIKSRGLDQVIKSLAEMGYVCRWTTITAASVGANHKRERWFLLAYANGVELRVEQQRETLGRFDFQEPEKTELRNNGSPKSLADAEGERYQAGAPSDGFSKGVETQSRGQNAERHGAEVVEPYFRSDWWAIEPALGRVAHGVPNRVDRIKCLGNSVVPLQVKTAFEILVGLKEINQTTNDDATPGVQLEMV